MSTDPSTFNDPNVQNEVSNMAGLGLPTNVPAPGSVEAFIVAEVEGAEARQGGGKYQNPFAGFKLPAQYAGDFWNFVNMVETFASNTSYRYMLTGAQILTGLKSGIYAQGQNAVFQWMSNLTGAGKVMPWAPTGLNATQYVQQTANLDETVSEMTGKDWAGLGLSQTLRDTIINNGWTTNSTALTNLLMKQAGFAQNYGWLNYGYNYQTFQAYKSQNQQALAQRYGVKFTDQQAVQNIAAPLQQFHASGGVFGESVPFVASTSAMPTGHQSAIR